MIFRDKFKAESYAARQTRITNNAHVPVSIKGLGYAFEWLVIPESEAVLLALGESNVTIPVDFANDHYVVYEIIKQYVERVKAQTHG